MGVRKLVYGVGINDADYVQTIKEVIGTLPNGRRKEKLVWSCPYYSRWHGMLGRCYSKKSRAGKSSYTDCRVCDEWLTFSNFKAWMEQQDWEGRELDKDLFVRGNKTYGPDTCCFISRSLNNFMIEAGSRRGELSIRKTHYALTWILVKKRKQISNKSFMLGTQMNGMRTTRKQPNGQSTNILILLEP